MGVEIHSIRKNFTGSVLVELEKTSDSTKKQAFGDALQDAICDNGQVRNLTPTVSMEVRDLDAATTEEEVREALRSNLGERAKEIQLHLTKARGMRLALPEVRDEEATKIMETALLNVGWTRCRVRYRTNSRRCFRCLEFDHEARQGTGPDHSKLCFRFGQTGHRGANCKNEDKCMLCTPQNNVANNPAHHIKASICPGCTEGKEKPCIMLVLQGNKHRSRTADHLLTQLSSELKADVLILSEQYTNRDVPG